MAGGNVRSGPELGLPGVAGAGSPGSVVAAGNAHGRHRNHRRETTDGNLATGRERQRARDFVGAREGVISEREDEDEEDSEVGVVFSPFGGHGLLDVYSKLKFNPLWLR